MGTAGNAQNPGDFGHIDAGAGSDRGHEGLEASVRGGCRAVHDVTCQVGYSLATNKHYLVARPIRLHTRCVSARKDPLIGGGQASSTWSTWSPSSVGHSGGVTPFIEPNEPSSTSAAW